MSNKRRLVEDRLEFVDLITGQRKYFTDRTLSRSTSNGGWMHTWLYFDALRNYLLLTCFDLLGQPADHVYFDRWLTSKSHKDEREDALKKMPSSDTPIKSAEFLYKEYHALYGVKNSFFKFIDILPAPTQKDLFYSFRIEESLTEERSDGSKLGTLVKETIDEDSKKKELYDIRNKYTHRLTNSGSGAGAMWPEIEDGILDDGVIKKGWGQIYAELLGNPKPNIRRYKTYWVRDWPNVLIKAVREGLDITCPK